jgi:hypothetical protein
MSRTQSRSFLDHSSNPVQAQARPVRNNNSNRSVATLVQRLGSSLESLPFPSRIQRGNRHVQERQI